MSSSPSSSAVLHSLRPSPPISLLLCCLRRERAVVRVSNLSESEFISSKLTDAFETVAELNFHLRKLGFVLGVATYCYATSDFDLHSSSSFPRGAKRNHSLITAIATPLTNSHLAVILSTKPPITFPLLSPSSCKVWPPLGLKKFETLSYLPPLSLVQLGKEVDYLIHLAWIPCLEFSVEEALDIVHVSKEDQESVFKMLTVVLWVGNVSFTVIDNENHVEPVADEGSDTPKLLGQRSVNCFYSLIRLLLHELLWIFIFVYEEHLFCIWKTFISVQSSVLEIQCFWM
ncbi:hypothetical protein ACSBR1_005624 [Camellia fascicularis]